MKIDAETLKKQVILHLPYVLFLLVFAKLGEAVRLAPGADASQKLLGLSEGFALAFQSMWPGAAMDWLIGFCGAAIMRLAVYLRGKDAKKYRKNVEYGSARWGNKADIAPFMDPNPENNIILTQSEGLMLNGRPKNPANARNKNVLVVGGSGSGKTRFFIKPNLMQMHSSYVVTDPKGTVLVECGKMLQRGTPKLDKDGKPVRNEKGKIIYESYKIRVFNTINFQKSMHFNPFAYIHSEKDILKIVTTLIANTKGEGKAGDDFWVKAETLLYTALIGYIYYEAPANEQNFATLVEMLNAMEVREDDESFKNAVDLLFDALEQKDPDHFALRQYKKYKLAAGVVCSKRLLNQAVGKSLRAYNTRRQFIFSVLLHREMVGVAFFQVGKQQIDGALIFLVVLAGFAGVDKFQQGNKVHFLGGGFVPDVAHQRAIQKPFCLYPKILRAFFSLTFGIRYQRIYQLQNIFLAADIHKGVVVHRFFEVNRIQYLNAVARPLQQLPALNQNRTFRVG